tara:strand:- start:176 stop:1207 length:1032 start_codon:yes stop_codon:yes gene_type:complete
MRLLFKRLVIFVVESPSYERVFEPLNQDSKDFDIKVLRLYSFKNRLLRGFVRIFWSLRPNTLIVCCTAGFFCRPLNGHRLQIFHAPASFGASWSRKYLDNFDILGAVTKFQAGQIKILDPKKKMFELGLPYLDSFCKIQLKNDDLNYDICYAPTYHIEISSIFSFLEPLIKFCYQNSLRLLIRPHPFLLQNKKFEYSGGIDWHERLKKLSEERFVNIDLNSEYDEVVKSGVVITDTSGLAFEFANVTGRPIGFIGEKLKIPLKAKSVFDGISINDLPEVEARTSVGPIIKPPYDQKKIQQFFLELKSDHFAEKRKEFFSNYILNLGNASSIFWRFVRDLYKEK